MTSNKKSVICGEYIIEIDKTNHVSVYRIYDNVRGLSVKSTKKRAWSMTRNGRSVRWGTIL